MKARCGQRDPRRGMYAEIEEKKDKMCHLRTGGKYRGRRSCVVAYALSFWNAKAP